MATDFSRAVAATIRAHRMISPNERVLAGLSGGPDSVALVRVLLELKDSLHLSLGIAHLHHGLRGAEADRDQAFAKALAADLSLPFFTDKQDVAALAKQARTSVETAGRDARYTFFNDIAQDRGFTRIALGHHRNDNAEQILMNLIRGSGPKGLSGIPPVRDGRYIRPLIQRSRKEILDYLDQLNQAYVLDSSNQDPAHLRNRIRHHLMPLLEAEYNPGMDGALNRLSHILRAENDFVAAAADQGFRDCTHSRKTGHITLSSADLSRCHEALIPRIIRKAIRSVKSDLRRITLDHIRAIRALMDRSEPGKHLDLPGRIRVTKERDHLHFRKESVPLRELGRMEKQNTSGKSRAQGTGPGNQALES